MYNTDDIKWNAVSKRDPEAVGAFVTAVKTTGIYCKPTCTARLPLRKNVLFFENNQAAKAAGFRACKRCKPDQTDTMVHDVIMAATSMLDRAAEHDEPMPSLEQLAAKSGFSLFHFQRMFKKAIGITPKSYGQQARAKFTDMKSKSEIIHYSFAKTNLGLIAVAATAKGVCGIQFGETEKELVSVLQSRLPKADLQPGNANMNAHVATAVTAIEEPHQAKSLPLDVRGTAFQKRVWQALQNIPLGKTASYSDIAQSMQEPKAMRAVAGACAANPIAVIVPCHRVLRADGGLSGYRWGVDRKRELLKREKAIEK